MGWAERRAENKWVTSFEGPFSCVNIGDGPFFIFGLVCVTRANVVVNGRTTFDFAGLHFVGRRPRKIQKMGK